MQKLKVGALNFRNNRQHRLCLQMNSRLCLVIEGPIPTTDIHLIEQFNRTFDPEAETIVPGNDKAVQEQAAKEFRRWQKTLEKIVPEKRQRALGLLVGE